MWKPGQIVTVCGKVCRVKKGKHVLTFFSIGAIFTCKYCAFRECYSYQYPCIMCCDEGKSCELPPDCYLEAIK